MRFTRMSQIAALSLALVGMVALSAPAATISASALATNTGASGFGIDRVTAGDTIFFQIAVSVDNSIDGNVGLATFVYDVIAQQPTPQMPLMLDAFSGFSNTGLDGFNDENAPATVGNDYYPASINSVTPAYGGGWGFDRAGLPGGGDATTSVGDIIAPGVAAELTWTADSAPNLAGLQPLVRQGVGIGAFTFGADDPTLGGDQGGFGFSFINGVVTPGDGSWIVQNATINTTGWAPGTYSFDVNPTAGAVFNGTLDYSVNVPGGFRVNVPTSDMTGASFSFTIIPEPATLSLLLLGGLSMVRRRRH